MSHAASRMQCDETCFSVLARDLRHKPYITVIKITFGDVKKCNVLHIQICSFNKCCLMCSKHSWNTPNKKRPHESIRAHNAFIYLTLQPSLKPFPNHVILSSSHCTSSDSTLHSSETYLWSKYKWVYFNRSQENIWSNHRALMLLGGNKETKRDLERERLSFRQKGACLPCMVFPRPWPNFQPCFWRSRCPMLSWCEEERKEIPQYSNNKKRFLHTNTHAHSHKHAWQPNNCENLFTVINATPLNSLFEGNSEERGEIGQIEQEEDKKVTWFCNKALWGPYRLGTFI